MEQVITPKKILPFSGNCVGWLPIRNEMQSEKIEIIKSPLVATLAMDGIFSLINVFNGRFEKTINQYYENIKEDTFKLTDIGEEDEIFINHNRRKYNRDSTIKFVVQRFLYAHFDVYAKIDGIKERVDIMKSALQDNSVYLLYSLTPMDSRLSELDIVYFKQKLIEYKINPNRFIFVESYNPGFENGKIGSYENYRNEFFKKHFSNVYLLDFTKENKVSDYQLFLEGLH